MKKLFLAVTLLALLGLGARDLQAQAYGPYYDPYWDAHYQNYLQWQQYLQYLQQNDPYYELHVMHYQLYLQPYQPYQIYQPCCYAWGVVIPNFSAPIHPGSRRVIIPRAHARTHAGPRSRATVGSLPPATSPLPRAVSPQPRGTSRR